MAVELLELECTQLPEARQVNVVLNRSSLAERLLVLMLPDQHVRYIVAFLLGALGNLPRDLRHLSRLLTLA